MKKVKVNDIRETIIRRYANGQSLKEIAADYNMHPTTLSNDRRRHADKWEAELRQLRENKIAEVQKYHQSLLRATQFSDRMLETSEDPRDIALHQQNLRELAYVSRVLADLLDEKEKE